MNYKKDLDNNLNIVFGSQFYEKVDTLFSNENIKYVSFDIFDTIFRRTCSEPSWVFEEAARRLIAKGKPLPIEPSDYRQCRIEAERQARNETSLDDIKFKDIFNYIPIEDGLKKELMDEEVNVESDVLYVDPLIEIVIKKARQHNLSIIFVSDMYLSALVLTNLIKKKLPDLNFYKLFVSSEYGETKQTGRLFQRVISELNVKPSNIVHIGDNVKADIESARAKGILAFHFDPPEYINDILDKEKEYHISLPSPVMHARKLALLSSPDKLSEEEAFFYSYGAFIMGPILSAFSKWILTRSNFLGVENILTLMREGKIFSECINRELNGEGGRHSKVFCRPCYASRKATFLPAADSDKIQDLVALSLTRKNYTVRDLFSELDIEDARFDVFSDTQLSGLDQISIDGKDGLTIISEIINNQKDELKNLIDEHKDALKKYFDSLTSVMPYALVDFGGGATIQSQLSKVVNHKPLVNFLLYVNSRGFGHSKDIPINSFIPYCNKTKKGVNLLSRSPEIFEIVLVGTEGTTLSYYCNERNDVVIKQADAKYSKQHLKNIKYFEDGVEAFQLWASYLNVESPTLDERISYLSIMERLIECPEPNEIKYLGSLIHEDNFGSKRSYKVINSSGVNKVNEYGIEKTYRNFVKNISYGSSWLAWPQGTISKLEPNFMKDYLRLRASKDKHMDDIHSLIQLCHSNRATEVIVYGAGEFFEYLLPHLMKEKIKIRNVIDKKAKLGHYNVAGYNVESLSNIDFLSGDIIVIASASFVDEIKRDIFLHVNVKNIKILSL